MRDPKRIEPFLKELQAFWELVPDWRFGQLVLNLYGDDDPWSFEEEQTLAIIREEIALRKQKAGER